MTDSSVVEVSGSVPNSVVDFLSVAFDPFYEVQVEPTARDVDFKIVLQQATRVGQSWSTTDCTPMGRISLDFKRCGWLYRTPDSRRKVISEDGSLMIEQSTSDSMTFTYLDLNASAFWDLLMRISVITHGIMIEKNQLIPFHGASVAVAGHGFLVCGDKGAGKTTLSLALAGSGLAGAATLSSDLTLVGGSTSSLFMIGTPVPYRIGAGTLQSDSRFLLGLDYSQARVGLLSKPSFDETGRTKVEVSPRSVATVLNCDLMREAPLTHVLWPFLDLSASRDVEQIDPVTAKQRLRDSVLLFDPHWMSWSDAAFNGFIGYSHESETFLHRLSTSVVHLRIPVTPDAQCNIQSVLQYAT